jgi:hypothetical protein
MLNIPLLTVELATEGNHAILPEDANIVISLTGESAIWQKERLINIGISSLPKDVDVVAWLDCDLMFDSKDWAKEVESLVLREGGMVQPFRRVDYLDRAKDSFSQPLFSGFSIAETLRQRKLESNEDSIALARETNDFSAFHKLHQFYNVYGMGWVAQRKQVEACGLYDAHIVGGADSVMTYAALGKLEHYFTLRDVSPNHKAHIKDWVEKAYACGLLPKVSDVRGRVCHCWHGSMVNRDYKNRHRILTELNFDPVIDLKLAANNTWEWANPQGSLAKGVKSYFYSRNEDG